MNRSPDILFLAEYIKNVLYFATVRQGKILKSTADTHYFTIDNELVYENYYADFGPLNLGCVFKYCRILNDKINQFLNKQTIVHFTSVEPKKKANAAFLLGCYGVLYLSLTPRDALRPLLMHGQNYRPFQDATQGDSDFTISLMDCLQAIKKAQELGFFNFQDFNYEEYERLDKIQGGDLNWIVPGKFLAFIGPVDYSVSLYHPPEMYINYFLENNVRIVVRLNKRLYDGNVFYNAGIVHYDLFFADGSCPPRHILFKFLQISEEADCAIAVHCKAGLGRTGSLIGCYLMKHYKMTSHEAIGWMRICRPGSVIGHQQGWLEQLEPWLLKQGNFYRKNMYQDPEKLPHHEFGIYSIAEKSTKQRPVVFHKSPSPPPPLKKKIGRLNDSSSPVRPQNSRIKEDLSVNEDIEEIEIYLTSCDLTVQSTGPLTSIKGCILKSNSAESDEAINKADAKERDWHLKVNSLSSSKKNSYREKLGQSHSKSPCRSDAGDPKARRPTARNSTTRSSIISQGESKKSNVSDSIILRRPSNSPIITTFRTSQAPIIKNVNEARKFLLRSSFYDSEREKHLKSTITVTPQIRLQNLVSSVGNTVPLKTSITNAMPKTTSLPQYRRRLGRSPSPPARMINEQTRATNTPSPTEKFLVRDASKSALKDVLSRLKLTSPTARDGSLGAASLGANREAPAPRRAPSVRSDERPLATQGDMLNCIKFERRLRDSWNSEKPEFNDKNNMTTIKSSLKTVNARTSNQNKAPQSSLSGGREKPVVATRSFFSPPRPRSPIGRRSPHPSSFY